MLDQPALEGDMLFCPHCRAAYRSSFVRCPLDGTLLRTESSDPLIGTTIGEQYNITQCIAYGATSRVYRAHHSRLQRRALAIKVLLGDLTATMSTRMRFAQEAELLSRLDHPNVVSVVDFARTPEGLLYLVMDLANGPTLAELVRVSGPLPWRRAVGLTQQLCRGLSHAHEHGIVHRDFKPDNVIIEHAFGHSSAHSADDEVARIIDFGIALTPYEDTSPRLTSVGISLGTPAYASPEQVLNHPVDHRADLFALGITLYEMIAGILPFSGDVQEILQLNAFHDPPPIAERNPEAVVPVELEQVVRRLMKRDPAQRYQSAAEVLRALDEINGMTRAAGSGSLAPGRGATRTSAVTTPPRFDGTTQMWTQPRRWPRVLAGVMLFGGAALFFASQLDEEAPAMATESDAVAAAIPRPPGLHLDAPGGAAAVAPAPAAISDPISGTAVLAGFERGVQAFTTTVPPGSRLPARPARTSKIFEEAGAEPTARTAAEILTGGAMAVMRPPAPDVAGAAPAPAVRPAPQRAPAQPAPQAPAASKVHPVSAEPAPSFSPPSSILPAPQTPMLDSPVPDKPPPSHSPAPPPVMALIGRELRVSGSLSPRTVERAVGRIGDELAACARFSTVKLARVRFVIDERGRASRIAVEGGGGELAACVRAAIIDLRTETPPDVGTVDAVLSLAFSPRAAS